MNTKLHKSHSQRGDISIFFTVVVLMIVIVSYVVIANISVSVFKNARLANYSAQAFYAADTGLERGMFDFLWSGVEGPANTAYACAMNNQNAEISSGISYKLFVDNGTSRPGTGACPQFANVNTQTESLCIEADGVTNNTQRRLLNGRERPGAPCPN